MNTYLLTLSLIRGIVPWDDSTLIILTTIVTAIVTVTAIVWFVYELYQKRKLTEKEIDLIKQKSEREEKYLQDKLSRLHDLASPLSEELKNNLVKDLSWLKNSFNSISSSHLPHTLFGERLTYFQMEKRAIMQEFVPLLLERCKKHIERNKKIYLWVDSGTTLYYFMEALSYEIVQRVIRRGEDIWKPESELFHVITNNLAGVQIAMDVGRLDSSNKFTGLAYNCKLLPGNALPLYSAVTGEETNEAVVNIRKKVSEKEKNALFIGILVGNWVRIRKTAPQCPIPMARGIGHLKIKQVIVENSDEVFMLSPLGKILKNKGLDEINSIMCKNDPNPYEELTIDSDYQSQDPNKIKLVTTSRSDNNSQLYTHSVSIKRILDIHDETTDFFSKFINEEKIEDVSHVMFPYDYLYKNKKEEDETEFPHRETSSPNVRVQLFYN